MLLLSIALVIKNNEYLESPECCEALAAAEVIVSVLTGDHSSIPQEAQKWLSKKQGKLGKKRLIGKNIAQIAQEACQTSYFSGVAADTRGNRSVNQIVCFIPFPIVFNGKKLHIRKVYSRSKARNPGNAFN